MMDVRELQEISEPEQDEYFADSHVSWCNC